MALQVWLPLNGNLKNQGLSGVTVTNSGATVDNSGKIGKCYSFSSKYIKITGASIPKTTWSLAAWVYPTASSSGGHQYMVGLNTSSSSDFMGVLCWYQNKFGVRTAGTTYSSPTTFALSEWHHVVATYNGTILKLYVDGQHVGGSNAPATPVAASNIYLGMRGGTTGYFSGKLNDVRIYDHCLSSKEVKEISKGLVLNYKLSDIINTNLLSSTPKAYYASSYNAYQLQMSENLQAEQTYTMQLWDVNVSHTGITAAQLGLSVYWGGGYVNLKTLNGTSYFTNGHADYLTFSFTPTSSQAEGNGASNSWLNIYNSVPNGSGTMNMRIGAWKLEKGSVATGLFGDITKEYDCSGHSNNGNITGTLTTNSDSPRYSYSTGFTGTQYIHLTPPTTEVKTISLWAKWNSIPSGQSVILVDYGSQMGLGLMSTGILCSTSGAGNSYTFPKSGIVANTWYHFVIVKTGTTARDLYINGIKQTQTSSVSNWSYSVNELQLGKRSTTSDGFNGKLSDFRAYVTALSESDVKELYNTSAYVYNNGTVGAYEFKEDSASTGPGIEKNGIITSSEFIEDTGVAKFYSDKIKATQIMEV